MSAPVPLRRLTDLVLSVLFVAGIATPAVLWLATGEIDRSAGRELRKVEDDAPEWDAGRFARGEYQEEFQTWYGDTFRLRGTLIRWHNALVLLGLDASPAAEMIVGKDDWMFFTGERVLDSYRRVDPFSPAELERWRAALEAHRDWLAARDAQYVFLVAPNKHTVYPEFLPDRIDVVGKASRLDQLIAHLEEHSDFRIVDVRAALEAEKAKGELLYFQHGTHWNDRGAYPAYVAMMKALGSDRPELSPWPRERFRDVDMSEVIAGWVGDTWAERLHLEDVVTQEAVVLEPLVPRLAQVDPTSLEERPNGQIDAVSLHPDESLPRAVIFRDSFANWLWYFLGEHFSRLRAKTSQFNYALVEKERPDVVLHELVERHLHRKLPVVTVPPRELDTARTWLGGEPVSFHQTLARDEDVRTWRLTFDAPGPARGLVRVDHEASVPGVLKLRWRAADGSTRMSRQNYRAGRQWVFLPFEARETLTELELDVEPRGSEQKLHGLAVRALPGP